MTELATDNLTTSAEASRGFWAETWRHFRRRRLAMGALYYIGFLSLVALFAPALAGTRPVVCKYKGSIYFPCLYYVTGNETPVFLRDRVRRPLAKNLKVKDPDSWALWPLIFQDPYRRVDDNEWDDRPGNPSGADGAPNRINLLGTNQSGVDVLAQMIHGTTIALLVGFVSMGIASTIGITLGGLAGYCGGWLDILISRLIELVMCVPALVLILALYAVLPKVTIWHMMALIGCTGWTSIARLTRAEFMRLRQVDFVTAAEALGVGQLRIMFRYILPNALAPILVPITFGIAAAILTESSLSFLGFSTPPPNPSWGTLLTSAHGNPSLWWLALFPGVAIFLAVLAYNLVGEGLQEVTDPRLRGGR
ncbi:MAG: ABC transporter permease [Planctomycetes bacterium]|nr:ABC transporter permease [Planctomycetota bacterium]